MCHVLLDNIPVDEIIKLFSSHEVPIKDDLDMLSFAPSEHLKKQLLIGCLRHLKFSTWLMICDILHNIESKRSIFSQQINGKLFIK